MKIMQLFVLCILGLLSCSSIPKGTEAVKPFDFEKYLGKWYEIARMDFRFERNLNNVTAEYSKNEDGSLKVVNRGYNFITKEWKEAIGKAKPAGQANEGKLKVTFFGPFYSGYNVIAIDNEYRYALVAGKNLEYLWILSRETSLPESIKEKYLSLASELGYTTSALIWTDHEK